MATTDKLTALAFAPSAIEGEAVAAFLALRRLGYSPTAPVVTTCSGYGDKATASWKMKIPAKSFDAFFDAITSYRDTPYYTFKVNDYRGKLLDRWEISLKVFFDSNSELETFQVYFNKIFAQL